MRYIMFRAWDKKNNEWYHSGSPELLTYYGFHVLGECTLLEPPNAEDLQHLVLQQFTGLLDKNGKEIYEGDILKEPVSPVGGEDGGYLYINRVIEWISAGSGYSLFAPWAASEVIGNIYENPELLNK